ncbi:hypothetical protein TcWFU_003342 [Taenia crassiceps]|uniref:Uncharacterized protein n=1 Tax=Taenia crassiceps TaxID=6207 RepID=A0ABR4Q493_9CEST
MLYRKGLPGERFCRFCHYGMRWSNWECGYTVGLCYGGLECCHVVSISELYLEIDVTAGTMIGQLRWVK